MSLKQFGAWIEGTGEKRASHLESCVAIASDECLDWQTSQFIDNVGKDDVGRAGIQKSVF